ncbi:hypothetical protein Bca4012_058836 [Brassica carinata]
MLVASRVSMEVPGGGPVRGRAVASQTEGGLGAAASRMERRSRDRSDFRVLLTKLDEHFPLASSAPQPEAVVRGCGFWQYGVWVALRFSRSGPSMIWSEEGSEAAYFVQVKLLHQREVTCERIRPSGSQRRNVSSLVLSHVVDGSGFQGLLLTCLVARHSQSGSFAPSSLSQGEGLTVDGAITSTRLSQFQNLCP